jgi:CBS domain-containing protein
MLRALFSFLSNKKNADISQAFNVSNNATYDGNAPANNDDINTAYSKSSDKYAGNDDNKSEYSGNNSTNPTDTGYGNINSKNNGSSNISDYSQNSQIQSDYNDTQPGYGESNDTKNNRSMNLSDYYSEKKNKNGSKVSIFTEESKEKSKNDLLVVFLIAFILISIFVLILYLFIRYAIARIKKASNLTNSFEDIIELKGRQIINTHQTYLHPDKKVIEAIDMFIDNNISAIPVISSGSIVGIVSKTDILKSLNTSDFQTLEETKIEKIMNRKFLTCSPETDMEEILSLLYEKHSDFIIIKDKSDFIGIIDYFNILKIFFESNFIIENPPILSECIKKQAAAIDSLASLEKVKDKILKQSVSYLIVKKEEKIIGIITIKDIIGAIKQRLDFKKSKAINIMSPNVISMTPGRSIYDAFELMIERKFNQIPIVFENKLFGIAIINDLVNYYHDLLKRTSEKKTYQKLKDD